MAESTITKILLRRGTSSELKLPGADAGGNVVLDTGEPGFATDSGRLYVGGGGSDENVPVPKVDDNTLHYDTDPDSGTYGCIKMNTEMSSQLRTTNTGSGCGGSAAICATNGGIYSSKDINCSADVISFCSSDSRLKQEINIIDNPLERLSNIKGVTFEWNDKQQSYSGPDTGVIAQDVEKIGLPGLVTTRDDGFKAVKYERLVPLLIESVKQLSQQVQELRELNGIR